MEGYIEKKSVLDLYRNLPISYIVYEVAKIIGSSVFTVLKLE